MKRKKIKNVLLKAFAYIMGFLLLLSGCALDSDSWIPHIVFFICMAWLALFAYANGALGVIEDDDV